MAVFDWTFPQAFEPNPNWLVDGAPVTTATVEVATEQGLSLTYRVTTEVLESTLRPLKESQGKVDVLPVDDGGFVAVDRADGGNSFSFAPPDRRRPIRQPATFHVDRYEESLVSQEVGEWDVELDLIRESSREETALSLQDTGQLGAVFDWTFPQTFTATDWSFDTTAGQIITDRIDADFAGQGDGGVRRFEITARLTVEQAHVFETGLNRLGGVRVKERPDGPNVAVDATNGDATVEVTSPPGSTVTNGDYVVSEWESTRLSEAYQSVAFVIASA
jgi:hypothetical protein